MKTTLPNTNIEQAVGGAIDAYRRSRSLARPPRNLDDQFNSQHLLRMAKTLSLPEITVLLTASSVREHGLALCRTKSYDEGREALREARALLNDSCLSEEARLAGESFQSSAEAYLLYRTGKPEDGIQALLETLQACQVLHDRFGYDVEVRRVHIVRNIVRVMAFFGDPHAAAELAGKAVRYLEGDQQSWPYRESELQTASDPMEDEERLALFDQVLAELTLMVSKAEDPETILSRANPGSALPDLALPHQAGRLRIAMLDTFVRRRDAAFLEHCAAFLNQTPWLLPQSWRDTAGELVQVVRELAPSRLIELQDS